MTNLIGILPVMVSPAFFTMEQAPLLLEWLGWVSPMRYAADGLSKSFVREYRYLGGVRRAGRFRPHHDYSGTLEAALARAVGRARGLEEPVDDPDLVHQEPAKQDAECPNTDLNYLVQPGQTIRRQDEGKAHQDGDYAHTEHGS